MDTPPKNIHAQALGRLSKGKTSERKKNASRRNGQISVIKRRLRREAEAAAQAEFEAKLELLNKALDTAISKA